MPEITLAANAAETSETWDIEIWAADHAGNVIATIPILKGMRQILFVRDGKILPRVRISDWERPTRRNGKER